MEPVNHPNKNRLSVVFSTRLLRVLALLIGLAACSNTPAQPTQSIQAPTAASVVATSAPDVAAATVPEGIVAIVNGTEIDRATFEQARRRFFVVEGNDPTLDQQILETLIEQELISQGATALNVTISDEAIQAEIETLKSAAGNEESWQNWLAQNNITEAELPAVQRETLLTQSVRDVLLQPYLGDVEQVNARHILLQDEASARAVLAELAAGADFTNLAAQHSTDTTTRDTGGDLGWFTEIELVDMDLAALAFELDVNLIAGPVESRLGWHIIQVLDKGVRPVEPERLPLLQRNVFNNWLAELYAGATIERYL